MHDDPLVNVAHVSRYYGGVCAVSDISFTLGRGEVLGLLGPNGAGKSTTMRMLGGVLFANSGEITIAGHAMSTAARQAKTHIGYLPETAPLYPDLTVDEYLSFAGRLRQLRADRLQSAQLNCKIRCGLEDCGGRLIANLSKGFRQRVAIAQAIIHSPAVVILDEPTAGLDPNQILEIRQLIAELGEQHSVILSSHILQEIQSSCSRLLIIHRGRLVLDKAMQDVNAADGSRALIVAFDRPPSPEALQAVDGVEQVEELDQRRFRIRHSRQDTATRLAEQAVNKGWGLRELSPEHRSLETVFMELTQNQDNGSA